MLRLDLPGEVGGRMLCHECLMDGRESPPVALCEHCKVFLCKAHLMALYRAGARTVPFFTCGHDRGGAPRAAPERRDSVVTAPVGRSASRGEADA
jgi:hypothetical protein